MEGTDGWEGGWMDRWVGVCGCGWVGENMDGKVGGGGWMDEDKCWDGGRKAR